MRAFLICVSLTFASTLGAQDEVKTSRRPISGGIGYVTQAELKQAFTRAFSAVKAAYKLDRAPTPGGDARSIPASRAEFLRYATELWTFAESGFVQTLRPVEFEATRVRIKDSAARNRFAKLAKEGAVAPYGPIATNPREEMTAVEVGDALGFLIARIAERSNLPSSRWTPYLQRG
jgi:hypothetical protein